MFLKKLSEKEITKIYNSRMKSDFPPSELKPLSIILDAIRNGKYTFLGLADESDELFGYAGILLSENDCLIDYLAIFKESRNKGYGGIMLELIRQHLSFAKSILVETENPEFAQSDEQRTTMERRISFYMRNKFRHTNVKASCFGVQYLVIETGENLQHTEEEIRVLYNKIYKEILPPEMFSKAIVV